MLQQYSKCGFKHYSIELYVVGISMILSEKNSRMEDEYFYKHVENGHSTLNCHQNEHQIFFHNMLFAVQYHHMKVPNCYWLKFFFSRDLLFA